MLRGYAIFWGEFKKILCCLNGFFLWANLKKKNLLFYINVDKIILI